jgi:hypothetical protein
LVGTPEDKAWVPSGQILALWSLIRALGYDEALSLIENAYKGQSCA